MGLRKPKNEKILIFDGDRELKTNEIQNLMILDTDKKIRFVFANRNMDHYYINLIWILATIF